MLVATPDLRSFPILLVLVTSDLASAGLAGWFGFETKPLVSFRTLDFLVLTVCLVLSEDLRSVRLMSVLLSGSGGGDRRLRIRGGVCARLVCRDSSAALLNNCPQSHLCSTSVVPKNYNFMLESTYKLSELITSLTSIHSYLTFL